MRLFKKQTHNQDSFKCFIYRLSGMPETDLHKVNQLLDVVFDATIQTIREEKKTFEALPKEPILDDTITETKNKLKTEQLEKRITHQKWCVFLFLCYNKGKLEECFL